MMPGSWAASRTGRRGPGGAQDADLGDGDRTLSAVPVGKKSSGSDGTRKGSPPAATNRPSRGTVVGPVERRARRLVGGGQDGPGEN